MSGRGMIIPLPSSVPTAPRASSRSLSRTETDPGQSSPGRTSIFRYRTIPPESPSTAALNPLSSWDREPMSDVLRRKSSQRVEENYGRSEVNRPTPRVGRYGEDHEPSLVVSPETDDEGSLMLRTRRAFQRGPERDDATTFLVPNADREDSYRVRASSASSGRRVTVPAEQEALFAPRLVTPRTTGPRERRSSSPREQRSQQPRLSADPAAAARSRSSSPKPALDAPRAAGQPSLQHPVPESRRRLIAVAPPSHLDEFAPTIAARDSPRPPVLSDSRREERDATRDRGERIRDTERETLNERIGQMQRQIQDTTQKLQKRESEILKLRVALNRAHEAAAQAGANVPSVDESVLLPGAPPPHVAGLTLLPVPLALRRPVTQQHGYLEVLEVGSHLFRSRKWKRRFVVADDRGLFCFRSEKEFADNNYHGVREVLLYRQCDHFVPTVASALNRLPQDPSLTETDRQLMLHPAASDTKYLYFHFVVRQPPGLSTSDPVNPSLLLRTDSHQDHEDWVHFIARMFNTQLYRDSFPQLFGEVDPLDEDVDAARATERDRQTALPASPGGDTSNVQPDASNPQERTGDELVHEETTTPVETAGRLTPDRANEVLPEATPMPPQNPPPPDAISAAGHHPEPERVQMTESESQTDVTVSHLRNEQVVVVPGNILPLCNAAIQTVDTTAELSSEGAASDRKLSAPVVNVVASGDATATSRPNEIHPTEASATQCDTVLSPSSLALLGGFETVEALLSALQSSAQPRRRTSSAQRLERDDRVAPRSADDSFDVFAVASLQAELLTLRQELTEVVASRDAQQQAVKSLQEHIANLEKEVQSLHSDLVAADATAKDLAEVNEITQNELDRLRTALNKARKAGEDAAVVSSSGMWTSPPPPPLDLRPGSPSAAIKPNVATHAAMPSDVVLQAQSLAQGNRLRHRLHDAKDHDHHHNFTAMNDHFEAASSVASGTESDDRRGSSPSISDLDDIQFTCDDCRGIYRELVRVVGERDALMREIARRHNEYTIGIAQMCERVIEDMDYLYEQYRGEQAALIAGSLVDGSGGGELPISMLRIDPLKAHAAAEDEPVSSSAVRLNGYAVTCALDERRAKLTSAKADRGRAGATLPASCSWRIEDAVSGALIVVSINVSPKSVGLPKKPLAESRYGYHTGARVSASLPASQRRTLVLRGPQVEVARPLSALAVPRRQVVIPHATSPS